MSVSIETEAVWNATIAPSEPIPEGLIHAGDELSRRAIRLAEMTAVVSVSSLKSALFDADSTLIWTQNGLVTQTKYLVDRARLERQVPMEAIEVENVGRLAVGYNIEGWNYYHWLNQCLPAIYAYTCIEGENPTILLPSYGGFQQRSIDLAGLAIDFRIVDRTTAYRCQALEVSNCLSGALDYRPSPWVVALFDRIREAALSLGRGATEPKRLIYVSRADSQKRRLSNEDQIIGLLESRGFHIAVLSEMSFDEQVRLFAGATAIVAPHGAGLTNIAFCRPDCKVYEMTPEHYVNPCFINLARGKGLEYWIDSFKSLDDGERHTRSWLADLSNVERRVDSILAAISGEQHGQGAQLMAGVTRAAVVQSLLGLFLEPSYLEIGVNCGNTFHAVQATRKVAVDPKFLFDSKPEVPPGCKVVYHEVTSDNYFGSIANDGDKFSLIFIDGLHTFEQTLRDLLNALHFLAPDGIIVIDDVLPINYPASLPDMTAVVATRKIMNLERDHSWMGDVFKLVFFIETFLQQFSFATVQNNHGQLVMWYKPRPRVPERTTDEIGRLQFMHCATERAVFRLRSFDDILLLVKADRR